MAIYEACACGLEVSKPTLLTLRPVEQLHVPALVQSAARVKLPGVRWEERDWVRKFPGPLTWLILWAEIRSRPALQSVPGVDEEVRVSGSLELMFNSRDRH